MLRPLSTRRRILWKRRVALYGAEQFETVDDPAVLPTGRMVLPFSRLPATLHEHSRACATMTVMTTLASFKYQHSHTSAIESTDYVIPEMS